MNSIFFNKKVIKYLFILMLAWVHFAFAQSELTSETVSAQRADYTKGMLNEDIDLITEYFETQVRLMPEAFPTVMGLVNARAYFEAMFRQFDIVDYQRTAIEQLNMGAYVASFGRFTLKMTNPSGVTRHLQGKYVNLWTTNSKGNWRVVTDSWNFDHQIDFKEEFAFAHVPSTVMAMEQHLPIDSPALVELAAYNGLTNQAILMRDATTIGLMYDDNATVFANYTPPIQGRKEIDAYWERHIPELPSFESLQNRTNFVKDLGQYVLQYSSHIVAWRSGVYSGVNTGKHVRIWKRGDDGRLKTYRRVSSYDK